MRAELNRIDSDVLGGPVIEIQDFDPTVDFHQFEQASILPLSPRYASLRLPAGEVASIRNLESQGFRFAELQLQLRHRMKRRPEVKGYPYRFEVVTEEAGLDPVLELSANIFVHDRITTDPMLGPGLSGRRYQAYVRKSFADPQEHVFVMRSLESGEVVSFATIRRTGPDEARLLIGGVSNEFKDSGLGVIHDYVGLATYFDMGIRNIHTSVSAINLPIMNLEVGHLGFKVVRSWLVMHKHYEMIGRGQAHP